MAYSSSSSRQNNSQVKGMNLGPIEWKNKKKDDTQGSEEEEGNEQTQHCCLRTKRKNRIEVGGETSQTLYTYYLLTYIPIPSHPIPHDKSHIHSRLCSSSNPCLIPGGLFFPVVSTREAFPPPWRPESPIQVKSRPGLHQSHAQSNDTRLCKKVQARKNRGESSAAIRLPIAFFSFSPLVQMGGGGFMYVTRPVHQSINRQQRCS
ncbi:hypothetical protein V8C26DRAFT_27041 [Trichoderma gracile]